MKLIATKDQSGYNFLIDEVGILLEQARRKVTFEINSILVKTYWEIGQKIVTFEQQGKEKAEYGRNLLTKLASDLTEKYGKGFSRDNVEKMRNFYLFFPNYATVSRNLSWSSLIENLAKVDNLITGEGFHI